MVALNCVNFEAQAHDLSFDFLSNVSLHKLLLDCIALRIPLYLAEDRFNYLLGVNNESCKFRSLSYCFADLILIV